MTPTSPDRFSGLLLGTAVGDALGLPAEGLRPATIRRLGWDGNWHHRFVAGRGMWSDDTEHTIMTAQALLRSGGDVHRFTRSFAWELRWWILGLPAGTGLATARAILKLWLGVPPSRSAVFSAGNGPCMRAAVVGAFHASDRKLRELFTEAHTRITHRDPKAVTASLAVADLAALLSQSHQPPGLEVILETLRQRESDPEGVGLRHRRMANHHPDPGFSGGSPRQGTADPHPAPLVSRPAGPQSLLPGRGSRPWLPPATLHDTTEIQVSNETTLAAARRLTDAGRRPLALNLANGVHPGGGFLNGARAQEETLCRSSALYSTLAGDRMYAHHQGRPTPDSTSWSILSPRVPVFRVDDGSALDDYWLLDFLTCAAPYAPTVGRELSADLLAGRIVRVLAIARAWGYDTLVLGAWGCGAFENDPDRTARVQPATSTP